MIVVDTSVLVAIVLGEPSAQRCLDMLLDEQRVAISAATVAEALLVANRRGKRFEMERLLDGLPVEIDSVTPERARKVADAHGLWGRGSTSNALNFGDCFAYALAKERGCPLLFVGDDFRRTDVASAL